MSAFDELLEQRKNRKAKGGTAFDELLATREYNKTQKAAYNTLKGINLEGIQSAVAGGNYIDRNTMDKYKYDLSTYIDNYSRLDTGNDDEKNKTLKDLTDFQNNFLKYYDYMTQFGNETDFNKNRYGWLTDDENFVDSDENVKGRQDIYEANKKRISEIDDLIKEEIRKDYHAGFIWDKSDTVIALEEEKNALIAENRQYEHGQGRTDSYFNLTKNEDFEKDSQNRDYTNPSRQDYQSYQSRIDNGITYDANGVGRDVFGEVFDEGYYDRIKEPETADRLGLFLSTPEDQRQEAYASPAGLENGWEMVMKEGNSGDWDQLRDKEIDIYYYLLENSGKDAADKYLDEMTQELNRRATVKRTEAISEADGLEKVMLNIASVPFSAFGGILSFAENALNTLSGNEINPYSQAYYFSNTVQAVRGSTAQDIDEWTGGANLLGISLGDAYQAGMSALDSALGAKSMGRGYTYAMGAGAASSEAKRLYEQGASNAQIAAGSLLAGTAEAFFEHFSLEHYFTKFIEAPPASRTKAILQVLAQGGIEASEEVATEIANTISNAVVMGSESEWHDLMQKYKDEGESDAAAFGHALVNDVLLDKVWGAGAGGLISGVLMGGFGTTIGRVQYNNAVKAHGQGIIDSRGVDTLRQLANDVAGVNAPAVNAEAGADVNTETDAAPQLRGKDAKSVSKALAKVDGKASAKNVGRLSVAVENAISGKNKSDIQQSLVKEGMSQKDAKKASEILSKLMEDSEYEFTDKEVSKLFDDNYSANEDGITAVGKVLADIIANPASEQNIRKLELTVARLGRDLNTTPVANKKTKSGDTAILSNADVKDKVSFEGKTVNSETNEEISINTNDAIKSVKTVNGQRKVLLNTDKGVVDSLNVKYASEDQAFLIESVADLSPVVANSIIKHYDGKMDVKEYVNGMREGILLYGKYNFTGTGTDISRNSFFARLSEADQALALEIGKSVAKSQTNKAQKSIAKTIRNAAESASETNKTTEGTNTNVKAKKGKVRFEKGAVATTTAQKNGVKLAAHLAKALGIDIYFYDSKVDTKYASKNGWFNKADNSIHLDLQAGDLNEQTIAFTMAHELTHFIEKWSPEKYKVFSDFLIEQYGKHGMSVGDMLSEKMDILGKDDPDFAMSELVADACEEMLLDSDAMVKLAQLRAKDAGLFEKIKAKIAEILNNLKNIYAEGNFKPNSAEANNLRKMTDVIEQMHRMFEDAAVDAAQNYQAITETRQTLSDNGITIDDATGDVSFNSVRYTAGKNGVKSAEEIAKLVSNVTGRSYEESLRWVKAEMSVANMILGKPEFLDFEPDERYDFIKNNSDYPQGTVDPNNLCRKREEFTTMFDMLQKMYPNKTFTAMDVANMRKILADKGIVVACGACFVEDRRQLLGEIADTYIGMWKEAAETGKPLHKTNAEGVKKTMTVTAKMAKTYGLVKGNTFMATDKYIPTQYDLTTYEGFRQLEKNHPMTAYGFIAYNNSRGQQAARLIEGRAEYKRQILSWSDAKVKRTNNQGGLRIFSFSDFQAVSMLDIIQVIIDCSAKGVKIQGYTKVPEFAKLVRNTGIKLNRSLMPKGETGIKTVDGKKVLDYDTTEGIDINDKDFLDEAENPDVGNILVGINPEQIGMAFLDDFVDYIIPFHTNKSKDVCKALGLATWQNYKESQHEKDIESGKASKKNVNIYTQVINKYNPQNKVEFVDAFLDECRKQKKIPRYAEFLNKNYTENGAYTDEGGRFDYTYREGYHKLLIDFKMFDKAGNILLQQNVTPDMDSSFMSEILEREVERKENYTFPQDVFEEIKSEYGDAYTGEGDIQASYRGKNKYGIEVYETSEDTMSLSWDERIDKFISLLENDYVGRTAKFTRNGHVYYAEFDRANPRKSVYGEKHFSKNGKKAYLRAGADGDIFDLVENSAYKASSKDTKNHKSKDTFTDYFDYFVKTVQIDGKVFNLNASVKKKYGAAGGYTYTLFLNDNKRIKASPAISTQGAFKVEGDAFNMNTTTSVSESQEENQNSIRNPNAISDRTLLANALESTAQNDIEKKYIADYKANIDKLEGLQAHLDEVNAEIKELSFSKGKRDAEKLKKLNEDKLKTANRINILDKKLLRLEAAKPLEQVLEREKNKAAKRAKAKADEAMARYREKSAAKLDDTVKKYQDARKKNVENRNKTAVRNKIKKVVGELDSLLNRGDRKRNVKNGMRDAVSDAISTAKVLFSAMDAQDIILDGVTTATPQEQIQIDKYVKLVDEMDKIAEQIENDGESTEFVKQMDEKYKKLKYIERQLKDLIVRERIRLQTEGTSAALQKLADAYRELSASSKTHINGSYDQNVYDMIINLKDTVGGTSIQDMSIEQLESVYKVYKLIKHTVTESNKIFREGKAEDVAITAERVCREFVANGEPLDSRSKLRISGENFLWNELKPAYAIKMMNSPTMSEMYHDFELAEDIVATDIREAYEFASKTRDKYNYNDWDLKATVPVKLSSGTTVELTVKKMMSIYAYSKRDHALEHMSGGGFVLNNKETFRKTKGNGKKSLLKYVPTARYAFRIYDIDLQNIADILGKEKCGYVDEMQKYLSYDMGGKGNEASNIVYGIDIFTEQYYFPLKSAEAFIFSANQPAGEISLKNSGMTKELVPHANNPIVLEDFDDVWAEHVNKMSTYHGFVVPIDNFNKVMNYTGYRNADMSSSVQTTMESVYGLASYAYMKKLIQDLNGGVAADKVKSPLAGFVGRFKKTAVAASGSVVIQQPTAIVRAMSMISPKYFKVDTKLSHGAKWEQLKKYAPVAVIKEIGGFDAGSGKTVVQYLNGNRSIMEAIDEKMMRPAGFADELGWNIIWDACKNEIADTTNLTGEELLQKAGERFSEVIRATQVYDSTLSRSGYMRSQNDVVKMATAFMGEPTTSFNMMLNAFVEAKRGTMSKGKAISNIAWTVTAGVAACILKSLFGAARKDDDDEAYLNKYVQVLAGNLLDELFIPNMLPFVKDVVSIMQGWDVERTDMALVKDLYDAFDGLFNDNKSLYRKIEDFGGAIGNFFGIPAKNIMRDARSLYNVVRSIFDDVKPENLLGDFANSFWGELVKSATLGRVDISKQSEQDRFLNYVKSGKSSEAKDYYASWIDSKKEEVKASREKDGKTELNETELEKEAKSRIKSSVSAKLRPQYIEAYKNKDNETMAEIRYLMRDTGLYGGVSDIIDTCNGWVKEYKKP